MTTQMNVAGESQQNKRESDESWPDGATVKQRWIGLANSHGNNRGWARRDAQGRLVSIVGALIATRFTDQTGVFFRYFKLNGTRPFWQHVEVDEKSRHAPVGPRYLSKEDLLADHQQYLVRAGCLPSEQGNQEQHQVRFFDFGETPRAAKLGYAIDKVVLGTKEDIRAQFVGDYIAVTGAAVFGQPGKYEWAIMTKSEHAASRQTLDAAGSEADPKSTVKVSIAEQIAPQYKAALAADDAFRRELVRVYGERNAGDARYKLRHDDPAVEAAKNAKLAADEALRTATHTARQQRDSVEASETAIGTAPKSPGQVAYERDLVGQPIYEDGAKRPVWDRLSGVAKDSWERNPTDRKLVNVQATPFYVWANADCANSTEDFAEAKRIRKSLLDDGAEDVYIADVDGVEVVDADIEADEVSRNGQRKLQQDLQQERDAKVTVYAVGDDGTEFLVGSTVAKGRTGPELQTQALDALWDQRLDAASCSARFEIEDVHRLYSGQWNHLFGPGKAETECEIVVDVIDPKLVAARAKNGLRWIPLSAAEMADLSESLFQANEIHQSPDDWDLAPAVALPGWASGKLQQGHENARPGKGQYQAYLYDEETGSGFIIRAEGDDLHKAEEWRDGDIADNAYGTYAEMVAWTERETDQHNDWRVESGYKPMKGFEDQEVIGLESDGQVICWNADTKEPYASGETLEDYGIHNLREPEIGRVGVTRQAWETACARHLNARAHEKVDRAIWGAVKAHGDVLGIEGDESTQVFHLLASLHEYCATYAVDLYEEFAEVRKQIASGDISSPRWAERSNARSPKDTSHNLQGYSTQTPAHRKMPGVFLCPRGSAVLMSERLAMIRSDIRTTASAAVDVSVNISSGAALRPIRGFRMSSCRRIGALQIES